MRLPIPTIRKFLSIVSLIVVCGCADIPTQYRADLTGNSACHERLVLVCQEHTSLHQSCQCMHPQVMRQVFEEEPF